MHRVRQDIVIICQDGRNAQTSSHFLGGFLIDIRDRGHFSTRNAVGQVFSVDFSNAPGANHAKAKDPILFHKTLLKMLCVRV